uniref:MASE1 domain-containing protein n=1 Tax=Scandinavium goeteborgense TaxID=1851514 RepID=UPI00135C7155|nr:MASE1 domain-containing protein [Scandinavium goeteborgense]
MTRTITRWVLFSGLYSLLALLSFHSRDAWSLSTTLWFPAALLFAVLWLTPVRDWPLWLVTAGLLHIFSGVWTGRPLSLACLFAVFDIVVFPLCVIAFRYSAPLLWRPLSAHPIARELAWIALLILCTFCGSALLSACLLLAGYSVEPLHLLSWALADLTGVLAILPFLREQRESPLSIRQALSGWRTPLAIVTNVMLQLLVFFTPFGPLLQGLNPLFIQLTLLLLSTFALSGRGLGILLLAQYLVVVLSTQQREGIFYALTPAMVPAIWQAQWYLVFSAVIVSCLHQYQTWMLHQKRQTDGQKILMNSFARTGSGVLFRMNMPTRELNWQSSTDVLFPDEHQTISTLELLEAHCDESFMQTFLSWYAEGSAPLFEQELELQRLNGQRARCLLAILRIAGEPYLTGGISQYPQPVSDVLPTTASVEGSPDGG